MRIALIVGINHYEHGSELFGCVDDAHAVKTILERHDGGAVNFDCKVMTGTGPSHLVTRGELKDSIEGLFSTSSVRLQVEERQLVANIAVFGGVSPSRKHLRERGFLERIGAEDL